MTTSSPVAGRAGAAPDPRTRRLARWKLLAILLVCAAPVIASYFTYYVIRPEGRTNYGDLIPSGVDAGAFPATRADGSATTLAELRGKWVMLAAAPAACDQPCQDRLYKIRQVRLTTGKDRDRVERVWLVTDGGAPEPSLLAAHEGMHVLRADPAAFAATFPAAQGSAAADHIFVVDPLGNVVMRFPKDADPNRMKKDIAKLLKASRIG